MNVLGTARARTSWTDASRGVQHLDFTDWTVDGTPLRLLAYGRFDPANPAQETTWLHDRWPEASVAALRRLLGEQPGDLPDGRVSLLVCPLCADLDCRALTAAVVVGPEVVEWRDVGWQVAYEPFEPERARTFRFDRAAYAEVVAAELARYAC